MSLTASRRILGVTRSLEDTSSLDAIRTAGDARFSVRAGSDARVEYYPADTW
jgi:hypothetical protein